MKQLKSIDELQEMFPTVLGVEIALLYGSFGRNKATPNSDIDIQVLVNKEFKAQYLINAVQKLFQNKIMSIREISLRNKVVVYLKSEPKIEFAICTNVSELDRNYLGSEITDFGQTILYQRTPQLYDIGSYLAQLIRDNDRKKTLEENEKYLSALIEKFIYEFESCSSMHKRSDGYQFYYFYNIAFHVAIQLNHLSKGHNKFNFLPKYFIANILTKKEQETFYDLKGTLFLPEANQQKRKLLDFFYEAIATIISAEKLSEVKRFCEWVYSRDFLWNFRDISTHNSKIKSGIIFRTATMTLFQNESRFDKLLTEKRIKTIIDLRADREIAELPYHENALSKFKYINTQFDPWNQPDWFKQSHHNGTNEEIAYKFFAIGCNTKIREVMEAIINEETGSIAIHCHAGKDRTGIVVSMLHLLVETPIVAIDADYLASEVDVKIERLNIVLDIIKEHGGIEPYLIKCGLNQNQIIKLKQKLLN